MRFFVLIFSTHLISIEKLYLAMQVVIGGIVNAKVKDVNKQHGFFLLSAQGADPHAVVKLLNRLHLPMCMVRHYDWYDPNDNLNITEYGRRLVETLHRNGISVVAHLDTSNWAGESARLISHIRSLKFDGVYFDAAALLSREEQTRLFDVVTRALPEITYWQFSVIPDRLLDTRTGQIDYWDDRAHRWDPPADPTRMLTRRQSPRAAINGLIHMLPMLRVTKQVADLGWFGPKIHVTQEGEGLYDRDATLREWWFHSEVARRYPAYMMIRSTWNDWHSMSWRRLKEWIVRRATKYVRR